MTTSPELAANLSTTCDHKHIHDVCMGGTVCKEAAVYTKTFARAVLKGFRETLARTEPSRLRRLRWALLNKLQIADSHAERDIRLLAELDKECAISDSKQTDHVCQTCEAYLESYPTTAGRHPRIPPDGIHFDIPPQEKGLYTKAL